MNRATFPDSGSIFGKGFPRAAVVACPSATSATKNSNTCAWFPTLGDLNIWLPGLVDLEVGANLTRAASWAWQGGQTVSDYCPAGFPDLR
ncbi:hypothetical protein M5D96_011076 [Drosophila gunungcola]|uniref:Uncharacterized protein n=1 Tax=Drosophila gunungcola TaxID=103775 RepID=A0A9Q0BLF9_9MUSC|nr:hypothetical protein M5D96_011076 [Drosophila gunungcola]